MKNKRDKEYIIYNGDLSTKGKLLGKGAIFLSPGLLWVSLFLFIPLLVLAVMSFAQRGAYGGVDWTFSLQNFKRLIGFSFFGWSADNIVILGRSILVSVVTTIFCVVLSYPLSFYIATKPEKTRTLWLTFVLVPFWTNLVIRTYAWLLVLGPNMPLAKFAANIGLIEKGMALYPGAFAVYLGMISTFLPFVTLPLYANIEKLDWNLIEAVSDLYGGRVRTFIHGILPQTISGLTVGITLTLIPAMGMFIIPDMLSGAKYMLIGNLIQQQVTTSMDWPFAATVSLALMVMTLIILFLTNSKRIDEKEIK